MITDPNFSSLFESRLHALPNVDFSLKLLLRPRESSTIDWYLNGSRCRSRRLQIFKSQSDGLDLAFICNKLCHPCVRLLIDFEQRANHKLCFSFTNWNEPKATIANLNPWISFWGITCDQTVPKKKRLIAGYLRVSSGSHTRRGIIILQFWLRWCSRPQPPGYFTVALPTDLRRRLDGSKLWQGGGVEKTTQINSVILALTHWLLDPP